MERSKQRDMAAQVATQKEQLLRYEKRLKDVVTAYKSLLREKEALETSLAALTTKKDSTTGAESIDPTSNDDTSAPPSPESKQPSNVATASTPIASEAVTTADNSNDNHLQTQIITLMNSLATLSAEKSRMEASFQGDKKQLRAQLAQKDHRISELQVRINANEQRALAALDEVKARWIVERQEREQETNNQMLMIRELQKLYADERHLKENIEMQLNNFKTQFASNDAENSRIRDLQAELQEARVQLKQLQANESSAAGRRDNAPLLQQLQQEMQQLKEQHAVAIKSEQHRVRHAEEQSKRQAALHEGRVANLEARLAELSTTVGGYDRLRQQDQQSIQALKQKVHELEESGGDEVALRLSKTQLMPQSADMTSIVEEIGRLKQLLMNENAHAPHPIDVSKVFAAAGADHINCQQELQRLQQELDAAKTNLAESEQRNDVQRTHIATLQDKVKVLNRNIDEQEAELKQLSERQRLAVREERAKWQLTQAELENEFRGKVAELEQQLQKQRQRSLQLLDDKEQEIKTLQTTFEVFHIANNSPTAAAIPEDCTEAAGSVASSDDAESGGEPRTSKKRTHAFHAKKLSMGDNCHMLHYANELARKDIEIAGLRKAKHAAETSLRRAIQEKVNAQEELCERIDSLETQVDRLERCKTREGANLEYLKNVIISYMVTRDVDGKRHMMNAISAVLQFTPNEIKTINATFQKK